VNKSEFVDSVAKKLGITKVDASHAVEAVMDSIFDALAGPKQELRLVNFGVFRVVKRSSRKVRNPRSGDLMEIPASKSVKFTPGKLLKDKI
jgi:DNA-binding protein HU-beta